MSANLACEGNSANNAKALASTTDDWKNASDACSPGNQSVNANDDSGFGAVPSGYHDCGTFDYAGEKAFFWSSTELEYFSAYFREVSFYSTYVFSTNYNKHYGFSVRCLRDE